MIDKMKHLSTRRKRFAVAMIFMIVFIMVFSTVSTLVMYIGTDQGTGTVATGDLLNSGAMMT